MHSLNHLTLTELRVPASECERDRHAQQRARVLASLIAVPGPATPTRRRWAGPSSPARR